MQDDGFTPLNADDGFHWLSEGLNADERDKPRPVIVRSYARTSRGGYVRLSPGASVDLQNV